MLQHTLVTLAWVGVVSTAAVAEAPSAPPQRDREAILAMAGCFEVTFTFEETAAIAAGYELSKPYLEVALECVEVVVDEPGHIALQHLLVDPDDDRVIKHWRQDWVYEAKQTWRYEGERTWVRRPIERWRGTWTQKVYSTDDSPRYEAPGRWTHLGNVSYWQSEPTHRPLPRREYSKRSDYHLLLATNRHTVTAKGWLHEQDNKKLVLGTADKAPTIIAHEVGLNTYERVDPKYGAAAPKWWNANGPFWNEARAVWAELYEGTDPLTFREKVDDESLPRRLAKLGKRWSEAEAFDAAAARKDVREAIDAYLIRAAE